jgi:PIN domain nuclease of toxin-antitoxin system
LILLDTHALIWLISEPGRLSRSAVAAITQTRDAGEGLAIADITLWEITLLAAHGRLQLGVALADLLEDVERRFVVRAITTKVCLKSLELPQSYPRDPADRIIGATALVEGMRLVTADEAIRKSQAVATIW